MKILGAVFTCCCLPIAKIASIRQSSCLIIHAIVQVRYIGVSNETSYGVMEFVHAAKVEGLPKIVSIQNSYSLLVRCKYEGTFMPFFSIEFE